MPALPFQSLLFPLNAVLGYQHFSFNILWPFLRACSVHNTPVKWRSPLFSNSYVFTCGFFKTRPLIIEHLLWLPLYDPRSALARKLSWPSLFGDWLGETASPNHRGRGWCSPIDLQYGPSANAAAFAQHLFPSPSTHRFFFLRYCKQ